MKPAALAFVHALSPRDILEARTVLHALGDYMNVCADRKAHGEAVDLEEWRVAGEMLLRGHRVLGNAVGMPPIVETSSSTRAEALMAGLPDPGEPSPPKKGKA
jgi:hypothetical protein